jgi:hypothetical protein
MVTYVKPGAYVEHQDATSTAIHPLRTDVAGFVGLARRGPIDTPVLVESFRQFETHFGAFIGGGFLAYAVRAFFENGGRRCWAVRVAARGGARPAAAASALVNGASGQPRWRIAASSPGGWGNELTVAVSAVSPAETVGLMDAQSPRYVAVATIAGFQRGDLVRIAQPGLPGPVWRVVSAVDVGARRLYWVHPERAAALPYDRPLTAIEPGRPLQIASVAYTLDVRILGRHVAHFSALAVVPEHPRYGAALAAAPDYPLSPEQAVRLSAPVAPMVIEELATTPNAAADPLDLQDGAPLALAGGADGLVDLGVSDFLGEPSATSDTTEVRRRKLRGIRAIQEVDEVAIVAVPDIVIQPAPEPVYDPPELPPRDPCLACPPPEPPRLVHQPPLPGEQPPVFSDDAVFQVQSALVQLCEERRDRIAVLDPPLSTVRDEAQGFALIQAWRARFDTRHAALYYPWLRVVDPLGSSLTRLVPPSGHVAGQVARFDTEVGVHRAPANAVLAWAEDAATAIDDVRHGELNRIGVNAIRTEPGRGLRILGARTLSSDPPSRYVNVRRLVMMVIKAIDVATQWAVFEPNDGATRGKVTQALTEFFTVLWQRGALVGAEPGAAFVVRCDETNNPPEARENGRLVADVAIAPSQPFEFVVLRVGRQGNAFEIEEKRRRP